MNEYLSLLILYVIFGFALSMANTRKMENFARKMIGASIPLWFKRFFAQFLFIMLWPFLIGGE